MTPTPTPSPTANAVNIALSNYWLATGILITTTVVIALALIFMWMYHRRALRTLETIATTAGAQLVGAENQDAYGTQLIPPKVIVGNVDGQKGVGLMYAIKDLAADDVVTWKIEDAELDEVGHGTVIVKFKSDGKKVVDADVKSAGGTSLPVQQLEVKIAPLTAAAPSIVIPFVLKNWGRLVVVLFGAGLITALIAMKALDVAAGVGILGVLLGAGAASTATSGSATESATAQPTQQQTPPTP